ncbi:MAG: PIN domain-containing protein [Acidobacteriaceae bacterium]
MSLIYWDTMLFVYWLESNPEYKHRVQEIHDRMEQREDKLCTSTFAVGEMLISSAKAKDVTMRSLIRGYFETSGVKLLPFDWETAELYSHIRAENHVSPADAIHLASAAQARADLFLTNDRRLSRLTIPGIHFIAAMDTDLF